MEVLLGTPPPAPPPNIPALDETPEAEGGRLRTVRERLEQHRNNPACMSCHRMIDPIGLALENFDVTGAWRIKDNGMPVDPASALYDGTPLAGAADLQAALLKRSAVLVQHFAENLTTYALGRRLTAGDMPTVRRIVRAGRRGELDRVGVRARHRQQPGLPHESGRRRAAATTVARRAAADSPDTEPDRGETEDVVHHWKARGPPHHAAGPGRHRGAAVPRRDGAGARPAGGHGGGRVARPPASGLHRDGARLGRQQPVGRRAAPVVAGGGRARLRSRPRPRSARSKASASTPPSSATPTCATPRR